MPQLAPPQQSQVLDRRGHIRPEWHRYLLTLGARREGDGDGGGGGATFSEPLVTGADPVEFITADGDVIVAVTG